MRFEEGIKFTLHFDMELLPIVNVVYQTAEPMTVRAENGWFQLEPAYEYEGIKGKHLR